MEKSEAISKIQKLLRLAESPNEEEAKSALLHARNLMAKYYLTQEDIRAAGEKQSVRYERIGVFFTARSTAWKQSLAAVIAEAYRCMMFASHLHRKQTYELGIAGLEDDFKICKQAILYAMDCVETNIKRRILNNPILNDLPKQKLTGLANNYAYGFAIGLHRAFQDQSGSNQEWGLVLAVPTEVKTHVENSCRGTLAQRRIEAQDPISESVKQMGYIDGKKYGAVKRLEADAKLP